MKTGNDYLAMQCEMSRAGASLDEVGHLICIAHYLFKEEGEPYAPHLAHAGEHYYKQIESPN